MIRVHYHLTDAQHERLRDESRKTGLSVAELIRRCIDRWLESREDNLRSSQDNPAR